MSNLVNVNQERTEAGFSPTPDNRIQNAQAPGGLRVLLYFSFLLIIPAIIYLFFSVSAGNRLRQMQIQVNEVTAQIDVQLNNRRSTLVKFVEATKSYVQYEKSILTEVTKLRQTNLRASSVDAENEMNSLFSRIFAVSENYPQLQSITAVQELMKTSYYLEQELAAARRLYNIQVRQFNALIFTFPYSLIAENMNLTTFPYFAASIEAKQDVDVSF
ncbi:LemA family protein [[Mycoplasma] cavipharyngis]|uniref:LemA family protein n=1 Tax=[Mycoplasma] cavipharyngis TaxID=92757 RepID=UPI0037039C3A